MFRYVIAARGDFVVCGICWMGVFDVCRTCAVRMLCCDAARARVCLCLCVSVRLCVSVCVSVCLCVSV